MPKKPIEEKEAVKKEKKVVQPSYYQAVGRRKTASARVKLQVSGTGKFFVNRKPVEEYFSGEAAKKFYLEPLRLTNNLERFDIFVSVVGSGKAAQLGAVIHGLSRALATLDREKYRPILKKQGLLTRDARARERRKPGLAGKARKHKQSPKR
ncbi:MAG: 30S ribosomal protein S9 [bacterium]|nr:30S ribosomal protein S9 [bacterium]